MRKMTAFAASISVFALLVSCASEPPILPMPPYFNELAGTGAPPEVQAAIGRGADVNGRGEDGMTPLMAAAGKSRNAEVLVVLLNAGADVRGKGHVRSHAAHVRRAKQEP